eukprot:m.211133 g.211133  ORF g.211133 m.211133 type:complete len:562 (+) comp39751_c0_seq9:1391-3076(+)
MAMEEEARYWLGFLSSALLDQSEENKKVEVVLVGNMVDNPRCNENNDETECQPGYKLWRVQETMMNQFGHQFNIEHALELDCSKESSSAMMKLRDTLKRCQQKCFEIAEMVPRICETVRSDVLEPMRDSRSSAIVTYTEFAEDIERSLDKHLLKESMKLLVCYLDWTGEIVELDTRICLSCGWLCSNIIGPFLSPEWFPNPVKRSTDGKTTEKIIDSALKAFAWEQKKQRKAVIHVSCREAVDMLLYLDLCLAVHGEERVYQIPALIQVAEPKRGWQRRPEMVVYRGRRYKCSRSTSIIPPGLFAALQCQCSKARGSCYDQYELWKGGIFLVKVVGSDAIECLVALRKQYSAIDIVVRCELQSTHLAKTFLNEVQRMTEEVRDKRSSTLAMDWWYLDSKEVAASSVTVSGVPEMMYAREKVEKESPESVVYASEPKSSYLGYAKVKDLIFVEAREPLSDRHPQNVPEEPEAEFPSDSSKVTKKLALSIAGSRWRDIAIELLSDDEVDEIAQRQYSYKVSMNKVITSWTLKSKNSTVGALLAACQEGGVSRTAIEDKYFSRK